MQLKTQSGRQGSILRGRPCVPHHTRTGPEWWSPAELRCDVMLTALASSLFVDTGFLFVPPSWDILTHMLFGHNSLLILVGITRAIGTYPV
jgi:hypothetical protein